MKWIVIGISGATCSGKSTIAKHLHDRLKNSLLISQDKYFLPVDDPRHTLVPELNHFNWEILSSLDMSKMYSDIVNIIGSESSDAQNGLDKEFSFLILEGFLLFNYKPIADLCHRKYFFDLSREICWDRRSKRVYDPPDVPEYFDKVVWPEYIKHKSEIVANKNLCETIQFLDGSENVEKLCNQIIEEIKTFL